MARGRNRREDDGISTALLGQCAADVMLSLLPGRQPLSGDEGVDRRTWVQVGARAEDILDKMEGHTYAEAAWELCKEFYAILKQVPPIEWPLMSRATQLYWEAVTRHVHWLLDSEEGVRDHIPIPDRDWSEWVGRKLVTSEHVVTQEQEAKSDG